MGAQTSGSMYKQELILKWDRKIGNTHLVLLERETCSSGGGTRFFDLQIPSLNTADDRLMSRMRATDGVALLAMS